MPRCSTKEALDNLLANVLNHSPPGEPMDIGVTCLDDRRARIEESDHESGVPPEDAERISEPYFLADLSRLRETGGAALELGLRRTGCPWDAD
jgi:two-component system OmpR family sensor kinase